MLPKNFWVVSWGVVLLDQATKWIVAVNLGSVASLDIVTNPGISFGLLSTSNQIVMVLILAALLVIIVSSRQLIERYPVLMGLFVGGGVSNLVDRFFFDGVRDWIPLPIVNLNNNVADWAIAIGVVGLLVLVLKDNLRKSSKFAPSRHG